FLLHATDEVEQFKVLHAQFLGRIGQAYFASIRLRGYFLEDMHEQFLLDQLCQFPGDIQLGPSHSTGNTAHPAIEIHVNKEFEGACVEAHGVRNSWSHLEQRVHTLGQKVV